MNASILNTPILALALVLAAAPALAQTAPVETLPPVAATTEVIASDVVVTTPPDTVTTTDVVVTTPPDTVTTPPDAVTTTDVVVTTTAAPDPHAGAFDALPPGGQKIARALYAAQGTGAVGTSIAGTSAGGASWSMDDIAAARSQGGWGNVFRQMKADGFIAEKNLGRVISGHQRAAAPVAVPVGTTVVETTGTVTTVRQTPVVVSYGNSASNIVTRGAGTTRHTSLATASGTVTAGSGGGKPMIGATMHGNGGGHAASIAASTQSATIATAAGGNSQAGGNAGGKGGNKHGK